MAKYRFIIVGSGWRSLFYVRIAKALSQDFEMCAMLCRTQEKADRLAVEYGIHTTTSIEECVEMKPDFVVVAVNKASIADISKEWLERGFTVLCETPAALEIETLYELWALYEKGAKLAVAEQYMYYPDYYAVSQVLDKNLIGEPYSAVVSLAHEYHGASLIRHFLKEDMTPFKINGKTFTFPTVETMSRYEQFTDGRIADKKRTVAVFEFEDGKVGLYDFDSEQYRSPIRHNYLNIRGPRGEIKDDKIYFLNQDNLSECASIENFAHSTGVLNVQNPELSYDEKTMGEEYTKLSADEQAIAKVMFGIAAYAREEKGYDSRIAGTSYSLKSALQDTYMAILLQQAVAGGQTVKSTEQPWHK
ncbi:MAG: Gfo/Idh/MocA family oxidoreductase [Lachnospiraceae bacterium]|nr:Gfo/Idh/MocA family oxidoreductase [Lachnospiraceae bacterium]